MSIWSSSLLLGFSYRFNLRGTLGNLVRSVCFFGYGFVLLAKLRCDEGRHFFAGRILNTSLRNAEIVRVELTANEM
jgi:hypothetical protein